MDGAYGIEASIADEVRAVIARNALLPIDEVRPDCRLADLGLDSLGVVETIFALEESFDISVPFNANAPQPGGLDLSTVGSVIAGVQALVAAK